MFEPIAIVGMALRAPGARDLEAFWRLVESGADSITDLSEEQLLAAGVLREEFEHPDYVARNPLMPGIDEFDAEFFQMTQREADIRDPQHRVFMEVSHDAVQHAGYSPQTLPGVVGVFAGGATNGYAEYNVRANERVSRQVGPLAIATGNHLDYLATGLAYKLNFTGPALNVSTACSTSLVAIHLASSALRAGECDVAVAGGVSVEMPYGRGYRWTPGSIVSRDGICRPFDSRASGTVFGNGCGVLVLKRLSDARRDRDTVHAVIRATAVGNDGNEKLSFGAPSIRGQAQVIMEAMALAGVEPRDVGYVEAHGTGTLIGDPLELEALEEAYRLLGNAPERGSVAVGAVKSNIGHLGAAAGVVAMIKTILSMEHGVLPPIAHLDDPNPKIHLAGGPFRLCTELEPWGDDRPLVAGVSSFGVGGTNAHAVIERLAPEPCGGRNAGVSFLGWTARDEQDARAWAAPLLARLGSVAPDCFADVAATLAAARGDMPVRAAVVASNLQQARDALETGELLVGSDAPAKVTFLFPGQGSQYCSMAKGLHHVDPHFTQDMDETLELLDELGSPARDVWESDDPELLNRTEHTQPLLFAVQHAVAKALVAHGVVPEAVAGHSIGEVVAAVFSGVMSKRDGVQVVLARGRLMGGMETGSLLAVQASPDEVAGELSAYGLDVCVRNSDTQVVVGGPTDQVEAYEKALDETGVRHRRLATSHAFHSRQMLDAVMPFQRVLAGVALRNPELELLSAAVGRRVNDECRDPAFWADQVRSPVRFDLVVSELSQRDDILVEVGPGTVLSDLLRQHPSWSSSRHLVNALPRARGDRAITDDAEQFGRALAQLWTWGVPVAVPPLEQRVPLPGYSFKRVRHWIDPDPPTAVNEQRKDSSEVPPMAGAPLQVDEPPAVHDLASPPPVSPLSRMCWFEVPSAAKIPSAVGPRTALVVESEHREDTDRAVRWARAGGFDARMVPFDALAAELQHCGPGTTVIHVAGLAPMAPPSVASARSQLAVFHSLFATMQVLQRAPESRGLIVLTQGAVDVSGGEPAHPAKAMVTALVRSFKLEEPGRSTRLIDVGVAPRDAPVYLELERGTETVVALRGDRRWICAEMASPLPPVAQAAGLRRRGVYAIFGGLGMIGLSLARSIADAGIRPTLILAGRRTLGQAGCEAEIEALRALGAEVLTLVADVSDATAVRRTLDLARGLGSGLAGVIHAAGVGGGELIVARQRDSIEEILKPKVHGALTILEALQGSDEPDFVVMCSSRAGSLGLVGSADYAAANAFLDAVPGCFPDLPVISIGWCAWSGGGMANSLEESDRGAGDADLSIGDHNVTWERELGDDFDWVTDDHRIGGERVMPAAGWVALLVSELRERGGGEAASTLELRDVVFFSRMTGDHTTVRFVLDRAAGRVAVAGARSDGTWAMHVSARYAFRELPRPVMEPPACPAEGIPVVGSVVGYGPRYQVLRGLVRRDEEILVRVGLPEGAALGDLWIDPALFDLATTVLQPEETAVPRLPAVIDSLTVHAPFGREVLGRLTVSGSRDDPTLRADIKLCDPQGAVLLEARGFTMRSLETTQRSVSLGEHDPRLKPGEGLAPFEGGRLFRLILDRCTGQSVMVRPYRDGFPIPLADGAALGSGLPLRVAPASPSSPERAETERQPPVRERPTPAAAAANMSLDDLINIMVGVLGRPIDLDDDFFDSGGDSLSAVQLMADIREKTGVETGIGMIFDAPTPRQLFAAIGRQ